MRLQPEDVTEAIDMLNQGAPLRAVATFFDVSYETIRHYYLKRIGIPLSLLRRLQTNERHSIKRNKYLKRYILCRSCGVKVTKKDRKCAAKYCLACATSRIYEQRLYSVTKACVICQTSFHPHRTTKVSKLCSRPCQVAFLIANNHNRKGNAFPQQTKDKISKANKKAWARRRASDRVREEVTRAIS